jgi:hypothetical protein
MKLNNYIALILPYVVNAFPSGAMTIRADKGVVASDTLAYEAAVTRWRAGHNSSEIAGSGIEQRDSRYTVFICEHKFDLTSHPRFLGD